MTAKRRLSVVLLFASFAACSAGITRSETANDDLNTREARERFASGVTTKLTSSPTLDLTMDIRSGKCARSKVRAIMDKARIRRLVWIGDTDRVSFAQSKGDGEIEEYARQVRLQNGNLVPDGILRFPEDGSGWTKLLDHDDACNLGATSDTWYEKDSPPLDAFRDTIVEADSVSDDLIDGRVVVVFKKKFDGGKDNSGKKLEIQFEVGIERETRSPASWYQLVSRDGVRDDAASRWTTMVVSHPPVGEKVDWRLSLEQIRKAKMP